MLQCTIADGLTKWEKDKTWTRGTPFGNGQCKTQTADQG